ncbi:MAG TPA: hypothetical protein PK611_08705, partial [Saprospiraceae bacterium]|nr:hypothetical protein [Saprospiraceae bacterium]
MNRLLKKYVDSLRLLLILSCGGMAHGDGFSQQAPDFLTNYNQRWVDSVFNTLTLDQKVGQLLMPRGNYSGKAHNVA